MARAYKRKCFQGRGVVARWLDRVFFSALGGVSLFLLCRILWLSAVLSLALLLLFSLMAWKRWGRFRQRLWQDAARQLRREAWLRQEAERIRQAGGVILYPMPDRDALTGICLRHGPGTAFHGFQTAQEELAAQARALGCTLTFHPWGEGEEPAEEAVAERLRRDAPARDAGLLRRLLQLPGNRYLLTGLLLLLLSILLKRTLYWRLLGSLCLLIGAVRRSFCQAMETKKTL